MRLVIGEQVAEAYGEACFRECQHQVSMALRGATHGASRPMEGEGGVVGLRAGPAGGGAGVVNSCRSGDTPIPLYQSGITLHLRWEDTIHIAGHATDHWTRDPKGEVS